MADRTGPVSPAPAAALATWERRIDAFFTWSPQLTLAAATVAALAGVADGADRPRLVLLAVGASAWTALLLGRHGPPSVMGQGALRLHVAGLLALATALTLTEPVYLAYAATGFFHAALLRPWAVSFAAVAATGLVVHSHIVADRPSAAIWLLYAVVVAGQTVAVAAGLYAGAKVAEVAEDRRRALARLELALAENDGLHEQLLTQAREAGVLDERQRMAREIHDTIAQGLVGIVTQLAAADQAGGCGSEAAAHLQRAARLARDSLTDARRSVQAIRPASLADSRLPDALRAVADRWSDLSGTPVRVLTTGDGRPLPPEVENALVRAVQEGLANVARHAAASRVGVTLTHLDDSVLLDIRDDGRGFDPTAPPPPSGLGLTAMGQRVDRVGGSLVVESAPGEGTAISIRVPTGPGVLGRTTDA